MADEGDVEGLYQDHLKEREGLSLRRSPICTCSDAPTDTPGLRRFVWDEECPEHRVD